MSKAKTYSWWVRSTTTGRFESFKGYFENKEQAMKWKRTHGKYFENRAVRPLEFRLKTALSGETVNRKDAMERLERIIKKKHEQIHNLRNKANS